MSDSPNDIPTFEELAADPEIAALLDFEPAPVRPKVNGWDADAQRAFVALLAHTGSKLRAARAIGRQASGLDRILPREDAASLAAACDRALALYRRIDADRYAAGIAAARVARRKSPSPPSGGEGGGEGGLPGQVVNEFGEWEDEESYARRAEDARDSIGAKLLRCRRLFLVSVSQCPGKRAAFEMLTELLIDWDKAARMEPQDDEPWRKPNMREPDMVMTAESGWLFGGHGYGPDKKAELLRELNEWRVEQGLEPIDFSAAGSSAEDHPPRNGEGDHPQDGGGVDPSSSSRT